MSHSEYLLHYIWKYRLFDQLNLETTDGHKVEVLDPGINNENAGPDFFNAKVKINDRVWAGNVEIHLSSDDWYKHNHHIDKSYNSTILHVVENIKGDVFNEQHQLVPQVKMVVPQSVKDNAEALLKCRSNIPCKDQLADMKPHIVRPWLGVLGVERLERKTNDIYKHLDRFNNSWEEVFFVLLTRNYGFGLNSDEFERLALSIGFKIIQKHSNNLFQLEALMFGQAGMLEDEYFEDEYYYNLRKEYLFLAHKYQLKSINGFVFKRLRVRPNAFPQIRIAQLACLFSQSPRIFSKIIEVDDYRRLRLHLQSETSEYWETHYSFGNVSIKKKKYLGESSLDLMLINTIAPVLFAYGKRTDQEKYCDRALAILESVKPEKNSIVREFEDAGFVVKSAFDSQAIIQLRKEYCDNRKCLYCKIGYRVLSKNVQQEV